MGRRASVVVLLLLVAGAVACLALRAAAAFLVVADPLPAHADAIVVLAGSPAGRLLEAADLHHAGSAPRIVLTRERRPPAVVALARRGVVTADPDALARAQLEALDVPAAAVTTLPGRAYSTASEARLVARWACRTRVRSLVVVTSPSHTRRARAILRRLLPADVALAVRPARAEFFPMRRWWRSRPASKLVLSEYQKLANFWLRERWQLRACGR
ncbi:MAG TPA: ElyC/SanA/YdcF family protein [Candidatus Limnocylindria bacterium]|nr:ElyC/SanA/YdcF family protein [Candidatus Limnocylindria bacterium]